MLILSCTGVGDEPIRYNFLVENKSGYNVIIKAYNTRFSSQEIQRTISINNNSIFTESYNSSSSDRVYTLSDVLKADSVVVSYNNNERKEIFTCIISNDTGFGCTESRNILNYYTFNPIVNNTSNTIYTFTSSDYDNAND